MFIIISAPTYRCGTTFVQRLLNTTNECMIYGENNAILSSLYNIIGQVSQSKTKSESQWNLFKKNKNSWTANINPSNLHVMTSMANFLFTMYSTPGYNHHGFKCLTIQPHHIQLLHALIGDSLRVIYCVRPFEEAYDSYKDLYGWMTKEELKAFYDQSYQIINYEWSHVLKVDYNSLNQDTCKKILEFVDCKYDSTIVDEVLNLKLREEPNYVRK